MWGQKRNKVEKSSLSKETMPLAMIELRPSRSGVWGIHSLATHASTTIMSLVSRAQRSSPRGHQALQEHCLTITYFYQKNKHFQFFFLNCKILIFAQVVHPTPFILKYFIRRHNLFFLLLSGKIGFIYLLITNSLIGFRSCICGVSHWHTLSLPYSKEGVWIEGNYRYFHLLPAGFSIRF